jgi:uracil-DNA glycosylase
MAAWQPKIMLVGEAPGYRGCRLSGIPFVSRTILQNRVQNTALFGTQRGYQLVDEWPHIQKEASATIVWQVIAAMQPPPLLWNAFPFHPHQSDWPQSNRKPTRPELALGEPFLRQLHQIFGQPLLVAVGNTAVSALSAWQLPHRKVRHPSHGGKTQFTNGLLTIAAEMCPPASF